MSLEKVLKNTSVPPSPFASLPVPFQNSPPSPVSPLQNPATPLFLSPSTLNPIPSSEAATRKDKSLEKFLKYTPSPFPSETLLLPPPKNHILLKAMIRNESKESDLSKSTSPTHCIYFLLPPP